MFTRDNSVTESKEFTKSTLLPTNGYKAKILAGWVSEKEKADGSAININWNWKVEVTKEDGSKQTITVRDIYIAKKVNGQTIYYYEKDGKKTENPAFSATNRMLKNLLNVDLFTASFEEKPVMLYNFEKKEEERKLVTGIADLWGLECAMGIVEVHENKFSDPSQIIKRNTIEQAWKLIDGNPYTRKEIEAGKTEPTSYLSWINDNKGLVNESRLDKSKLSGSSISAYGSTTQALEIG